MEVTLKSINKMFDAMEGMGVKQVFFSRVNHVYLYNDINRWFYKRSKSVSDNKYIHGEGQNNPSGWSFVRQGGKQYDDRLRITFLDHQI